MDPTGPLPPNARDRPVTRTPGDARSVRLARYFLPPYLLVVALIVFLPAPEAGQLTGIVGWAVDVLAALGASRELSAIALEFVANIALFVPFGLLLSIAAPRLTWWGTIALGCLTSVGIELIQIGIPSRFPTVSDVIANTAGTAVGVGLNLLRRRPRRLPGSDRSPT
ncbi:VanZ family protein [Agromyces ramosus]|nr:VanZ family protein [Agromyces ramosus]